MGKVQPDRPLRAEKHLKPPHKNKNLIPKKGTLRLLIWKQLEVCNPAARVFKQQVLIQDVQSVSLVFRVMFFLLEGSHKRYLLLAANEEFQRLASGVQV